MQQGDLEGLPEKPALPGEAGTFPRGALLVNSATPRTAIGPVSPWKWTVTLSYLIISPTGSGFVGATGLSEQLAFRTAGFQAAGLSLTAAGRFRVVLQPLRLGAVALACGSCFGLRQSPQHMVVALSRERLLKRGKSSYGPALCSRPDRPGLVGWARAAGGLSTDPSRVGLSRAGPPHRAHRHRAPRHFRPTWLRGTAR